MSASLLRARRPGAPRKFEQGERIYTFGALDEILFKTGAMLWWRGRPLHPSFVAGWSHRLVNRVVIAGEPHPLYRARIRDEYREWLRNELREEVTS